MRSDLLAGKSIVISVSLSDVAFTSSRKSWLGHLHCCNVMHNVISKSCMVMSQHNLRDCILCVINQF